MVDLIDTSPQAFAYRPFPVGVLPEPLQSFVREASRAIGCDPSMIALPSLAVAASCVGNARRIRLKRTWAEPCIIWTATVAPSGSLKSPAFRSALAPLHAFENEAAGQYDSMLALHEQEMMTFEAAMTEWRKRGRKQNADPPVKPRPPAMTRYIIDDITVESVAGILIDNPRGVLLGRDELSGWFGSFDSYRRGRGGDAARWIEMFHGQPLSIDRKSSGMVRVPRAAVSVCGTIQPGTLMMRLGEEHVENGLAARLLFAMPPARAKRWNENELSADVDSAYVRLLTALRDLPAGVDEQGQPRPVDVALSEEGRKAWVEFYNAHAEQQNGMMGEMAAALSKLEGYCARLALLIHLIRALSGCSDLKDPNAIDAGSVACAVQLVRWFRDEAQRVYGHMSESAAQRQARLIVERARANGGEISVRDLQRSPGVKGRAADIRTEIQSLQSLGVGKLINVAGDAGRSKEVFVLDDAFKEAGAALPAA